MAMDHDAALQVELQHLRGGLWLSDYVRLMQLNLRTAFKYVICILQELATLLRGPKGTRLLVGKHAV